uniref:Uncharacterized protein LOC113789119 n=1 Tax=Dermatophagoides pteronyssinus TaxID=6956 RepID=A0A6P6XNS2_DERPT|nr:uncharacterized protein LOC113789119 [Dermatophagoides pteronyssinus]
MSCSSSMETKYNFNDKVAIVTGSSSGIGAEIARQFARNGAQVTITGRDSNALQSIADEIEKEFNRKPLQIIGDLVVDQSTLPFRLINETISAFGRLDFLVNNAGGGSPYDSLLNENLMQGFDQVFTLNVRSVVYLTQLAVPYLEKTCGNIINISSMASIRPHSILYSSSKAAVDMITKTSAQELGGKGIRVNSINPGSVTTRYARSIGLPETILSDYEDDIREKTILKFVPKPIEIAKLAMFLASDDARNMTGSNIVTDSGSLLMKPY